MQNFILTLCLCVAFIEAIVVPDPGLSTSSSNAHCQGRVCQEKHIFPRAQREKCDAARYPQKEKSLEATRSINNVSIVRRAMNLPTPGLMDAFIMDETGDNGDGVAVVWSLYDKDSKNEYDVNTAVYYDYKKERSLVATMLRGCTMLAIINRKAVYMGHYWESLAFAPDEVPSGDTKEDIFQRIVIGGLRNGVDAPGRALQMSLTRFAKDYADDNVRAFLIRPHENSDQNNDGRDGYPDEWAMMRNEVVRIIPKIGEPGRWESVIYNVAPNRRILESTVAGRVLFKVDPEHVPAVSRRKKATSLAVLWVEDREIYRDEWQDS
ncbi:hypothetical protein DE146DRAFT_752803 [Phaeosphaeria sp. MPI-PUGE-AT-0046c]|nr:hypothetical protein DE146DRAFT_752803 [Phaeosphaeria sp. MPI-PUGE-AT-0046c]